VNRRGLILLVLAMLAVPAVVVCGPWAAAAARIFLDDLPHNSHARAYMDQVKVHQRYKRIGTGSSGTCKCDLANDYVGPTGIDPAHVFAGPKLIVEPWPTGSVGNTRPWDYLLRGTGESKRAGVCSVYIHRYRHDYDPLDVWSLSDKQHADFKAGKLEILELSVGCERDGQ